MVHKFKRQLVARVHGWRPTTRFFKHIAQIYEDAQTHKKHASKKKARLAKFASVSKIDTLEEDKKKARAIRFSNPLFDSLSQVNGKGKNIKTKIAIADKASGGA